MNKFLIISIVFVVSIGGGFAWKVLSVNDKSEATELSNNQFQNETKRIKYRIALSNPTNVLVKNPSLLVAVPIDQSRYEVADLFVSVPYTKNINEVGNVSIHLDIKAMMPYETKLIDISVNLLLSPRGKEVLDIDVDNYTKAEKYIEANNEKIKRQAKLFKEGSQLEQAQKTYEWVINYLSDSGFVEEDRGALYALEHKKADCTEYMYLYGALLRANKIPTRMMSGFIVESNKRLKIKDYHNWVEIYLDGNWRVVDPQNKKFLEDENDYIAMRIIDNSRVTSFENSQQMFVADSGLRVSME